MPDAPTTRLGLYKSASDGSEDVNYTQDIGQNLDKLDAAAGFQIVTSSTRPSSPYPGKPIAESNTSYRTYFSNGTAPASASWVEIPNSSGTYGGNLAIASGSSITWNGDTNLRRDASGAIASDGLFRSYRSTTSGNAFSSRVTGDTASRWFVNADGATAWGPGGAASSDVTLARTGVGALTLTGSLAISSGLTVGATTWTTYTPTVTNGGTVTWATRTGYYYKLGKIVFVLVYLAVNTVGSGSGIVSVDMPSSVDRTTRQILSVHAETIGANGSATSSIRGGECVFFTGGTAATSDRIRVNNGTSNESNILGNDLLAGGTITIQGWYREA